MSTRYGATFHDATEPFCAALHIARTPLPKPAPTETEHDRDEREMVPGEGIEPPTFGLQNRCTTAVLTRRRGFRPVGRFNLLTE